MKNDWSKTAGNQLRGILRTITRELSKEDAQRWRVKIMDAVKPLRTYPDIGSVVPSECYLYPPSERTNIRQVFCPPYRIIYETTGNVNRILAILHERQIASPRDIRWDK